MAPNVDFQSQFFNLFSVSQELQNKELDPNVSYYLDQVSSLDTKNYVPGEVKNQLKGPQFNAFMFFI